MDDHCRHVLQLRKIHQLCLGDTERNRVAVKIYMLYYMVPCVIMYDIKADALWAIDRYPVRCVCHDDPAVCLYAAKGNHAACKDFWDRYLPAYERGEHPPVVSFGTIEERK